MLLIGIQSQDMMHSAGCILQAAMSLWMMETRPVIGMERLS